MKAFLCLMYIREGKDRVFSLDNRFSVIQTVSVDYREQINLTKCLNISYGTITKSRLISAIKKHQNLNVTEGL